MKLWLVIYFFGEVAGSVGPLPYATAEQGEALCRGYSAQVLEEARAAKPGASVQTMDGRVLTHGDVTAECEWHDERPVTDPRWSQ